MKVEITLRYDVDDYDDGSEVVERVYDALRLDNLDDGFDQNDIDFVETLWERGNND